MSEIPRRPSPMSIDNNDNAAPPEIRALTTRQERRLVNYLDDRFMEFTRNFKKRTHPSSTLRTLSQYLEEARHLMALILQIPPVDPSTSLRTFYLLRLTGDALSSIPGYHLTEQDSHSEPVAESSRAPLDLATVKETLRDLLDFLDDLDHAWLIVLRGLPWDPSSAQGTGFVELAEALDEEDHGPSKTTLPSQTDITRLRSLLLGGESSIEEWLLMALRKDSDADDNDLTGLLDRLGLLEEFDDIFTHTMDFLGGFSEDKLVGRAAPHDSDDDEELSMACDFEVLQ